MEYIESLLQEALSLCQSGQFNEGKKIYLQLLELVPGNTRALSNLGSIALQSGNLEESIEFFSKSLQLDSNQPIAFYNYGMALHKAKKYEEALAAYKRAVELKSDFTQVYLNRGITYYELKYYDDALANYDHAIRLKPDYAEVYSNRGITYYKLKYYDDALASYEHAIRLKPDYAEAYSNRGNTYNELKRYDEAFANYDHAIQLKPDYAEAYSNRGNTYNELKRYDDALVNYEHAIRLKPDYAEAYSNRGASFVELKRYDDALASYDRAIQLKPEIDYLLGNVIYTKMHLCDWLNLDILVNQLTKKIMKHEIATMPFITLALIDDPELHKQSAGILINDKYPISNTLPKISKYPKHQKIRIGYFSADFCNHPVSYLTAELFELHNRDQFEIIAFSFGLNTQDSMRQRLEKGFDQFIDVSEKLDTQIALLAREMEIDIAVDLGGFTGGSRVGIFAMKVAPIQVNYLGYPGTMAAKYIDYIIADSTLIPDEEQFHYSERVVYLPETYMVNDSKVKPSEEPFSRKNFGLPEYAFIFACFNASYKITPATFSGWMRILGAVDNSVLWLSGMNQTAIHNLKNKANECGINNDRIIFASIVPSPSDHLNRIKLADLFLDTFPYNAHTTCNDALRVGLPVLTLMGKSFASRVAGSLLNVVGLPELITTTQEKYESLAIELATNPAQLEKIKTKLAGNLPTSPLYNTKLFAHHIELAYQEMYKRYQDELMPDHIYVLQPNNQFVL